jgi:hypothetical protein
MAVNDRVRKVDVESMENEQVDLLAEQLGAKVRGYVDEACEKANAVLKIYGLQAKMEFVLEPITEK